jgi:hypothetical protein
MRTAPGARAQIGNQLGQLNGAAARFDPDEDIAGGRSDQKVEVVSCRAVVQVTRLQGDMAAEPAAFENETGCSRELADVFPEEPHRVV